MSQAAYLNQALQTLDALLVTERQLKELEAILEKDKAKLGENTLHMYHTFEKRMRESYKL